MDAVDGLGSLPASTANFRSTLRSTCENWIHQFQQNLAAHAIAVGLTRALSNRLDDLRPPVPRIVRAVAACEAGKISVVGA